MSLGNILVFTIALKVSVFALLFAFVFRLMKDEKLSVAALKISTVCMIVVYALRYGLISF